MRAAMGSASWCASASLSARSTLATPSSFAAASAAGRQPWPATRTCTGAPSALAAVSAFSVASWSFALSCSATRSVVMMSSSKDAGLVAQLGDELGDRAHLGARLALRRLRHLQHLEPRRHVDPERLGRGLVQGLLLGLHDVRQARIARLVEAQVRGHDG